jgi:hypothetical protein
MMQSLNQLSRDGETAPRRGLFGVLAGTGLGVLVGASRPQVKLAAKDKKKKKKKKKNKRASCLECPASCTFEFVQAGGGKICGIGSNAPETCRPCTSSSQCAEIDENYPHCVVEAKILSLGQTVPLACPASPPGLCTSVPACVI